MDRMWRRDVGILLAVAPILVVTGALTAQQQPPPGTGQAKPPVNRDAQLSVDFLKRVEEYVALHRKLEDTLPDLSKEALPANIDRHQRELGRLIEQARPNAQPGTIFFKESRAYFRRQLAAAFAGTQGSRLRESINDENPGPIRLRVNGRYPDTIPLTTMPPQVLASLPKLPEELEYRFIGERLILLDVHAHVIVDYMDDALPL
jgi:hypothetical protein